MQTSVAPIASRSGLQLLSMAVALTGCHASEAVTAFQPEGGSKQIVHLSAAGPAVVRYVYRNPTPHDWPLPIVSRSCGCTEAVWSDTVIRAGGTTTLELRTNMEAVSVRSFHAILTWASRAVTRLDWTLATPRIAGLRVSPEVVSSRAVSARQTLILSFIADYAPDDAPSIPMPIAAQSQKELTLRILNVSPQTRHVLGGMLAIDCSNTTLATDDPILLSFPGLSPTRVAVIP